MSLSGNGVIGIRREDKNKWERRVPVTPGDVKKLVEQGIRVIVQPSSSRTYPDADYEDSGATLSEDLSEAGTILAVKEVPINLLLEDRTYVFFSHTIKAQVQSMPLLDAILEKRIRLFDYEAITEGGVRGGPRLVAFGRYAGLAGAIDFCRGLGERLLSLGYSTPFLGVGSTYQYANLTAALDAVRSAGNLISKYGLPEAICPFTVAVTGQGRVANGAIEVWNNLPVKWVDPFELRDIVANATGREKTHVIYMANATAQHMVCKRQSETRGMSRSRSRGSFPRSGSSGSLASRGQEGLSGAPSPLETYIHDFKRASSNTNLNTSGIVGSARATVNSADSTGAGSSGGLPPRPATSSVDPEAASGAALDEEHIPMDVDVDVRQFDRADYKAHPEMYDPIFHIKVVPYVSAIINCMYWDARFPRLLTNRQLATLAREKRLRLVGVEEISCDFEGSLEFLREFTTIEKPFAVYNPLTRAVSDDLDAEGFMYQAVDHLPSECPRDASEHFSEKLLPFLPQLARCSENDADQLPPELRASMVTFAGSLTEPFHYIAGLRAANERASCARLQRRSRQETSVVLRLSGHLFDTKVVNLALDTIEEENASAQILDFRVGKDRSTGSDMRLQLFQSVSDTQPVPPLDSLLEKLQVIASKAGVELYIEEDEEQSADNADALVLEDAIAAVSKKNQETGFFLPVDASLAEQAAISAKHHAHDTLSSSSFMTAEKIVDSSRNVLVLGAGHVAGPALAYLLRDGHNSVAIVSVVPGEADRMVENLVALFSPSVRSRVFGITMDIGACLNSEAPSLEELQKLGNQDMNKGDDGMQYVPGSTPTTLTSLMKWSHVVVSLVPAVLHVPVARLCVRLGRDLVTASYVAPEMEALSAVASSRGVCLANELGLDPGMDHLAAMRMLDNARAAGGRIITFSSVCGGLPAPEAANNPLGYKFSWFPRGALLTARNAARFLRGGRVVEVPGQKLLSTCDIFQLNPAMRFEVLPNRDSISYQSLYKLNDSDGSEYPLRGCFRGTLRHPGFCAKMRLIDALGFLETNPIPTSNWNSHKTWISWAAAQLGVSIDGNQAFVERTMEKAGLVSPQDIRVSDAETLLEWLGFFNGAPSDILRDMPPSEQVAPIDVLVKILTAKPEMSFGPRERDMAVMSHSAIVYFPPGSAGAAEANGNGVWKKYTSSLVAYGSEVRVGGTRKMETAMAKTVGSTAAVATQLLLNKKIQGKDRTGVIVPLSPQWYNQMLAKLEEEGLEFEESVEVLPCKPADI